MNFFATNQCKKRAFCQQCRSINAGRSFREELTKLYEGLTAIDFDCPNVIPWIEDAPVQDATPYDQIRNIILSAPSASGWTDLKEELRIHEESMRLLEKSMTPCWLKRQQQRIVTFFNTALEKGLITQESIHAIVVQQR